MSAPPQIATSPAMRLSRAADAIDALRAEREHIAQTLATFYRAPLSMSSVQPVLTLAEELCPALVKR